MFYKKRYKDLLAKYEDLESQIDDLNISKDCDQKLIQNLKNDLQESKDEITMCYDVLHQITAQVALLEVHAKSTIKRSKYVSNIVHIMTKFTDMCRFRKQVKESEEAPF